MTINWNTVLLSLNKFSGQSIPIYHVELDLVLTICDRMDLYEDSDKNVVLVTVELPEVKKEDLQLVV